MRKTQRLALAAAFTNGYRQACERVRAIAQFAPTEPQCETVMLAADIVVASEPDPGVHKPPHARRRH